jgi:hypothetical protein
MDNELIQAISATKYLTPSRYVSGRIVEYDIKSANISVLREYDIITQEDYDYLSSLPKILREKEIGIRERNDPELYNKIKNGIIESKVRLAQSNNINIDSIIRVANDAVYINSNIDLSNTKFGNYIEFMHKSEYNVFCNLNGVIIFCSFLDDGNIDIDIKGIGDVLSLHRDYMVYTIMSTITLLERSSINDAIGYLSDICEQYLKRELPVGYYREFNSASLYKVSLYDVSYGLYNASDLDKASIDINYNYTILRELWSILVEIYTLRTK